MTPRSADTDTRGEDHVCVRTRALALALSRVSQAGAKHDRLSIREVGKSLEHCLLFLKVC